MRRFNLPDLGEGLEEAEIVAWYFNEGDNVVADQPLYAVFRKADTRAYCTYNSASQPRTVVFSDGFRLKVEAKSWATARQDVKDAQP